MVTPLQQYRQRQQDRDAGKIHLVHTKRARYVSPPRRLWLYVRDRAIEAYCTHEWRTQFAVLKNMGVY